MTVMRIGGFIRIMGTFGSAWIKGTIGITWLTAYSGCSKSSPCKFEKAIHWTIATSAFSKDLGANVFAYHPPYYPNRLPCKV